MNMRIIAGEFKNHLLMAPKGIITRPTSAKLRESVFNICQHYVEGANFLDLFAGSGAMGIEALSRGAVGAVFIDQSAEAVRCIQSNLNRLKLEEKGKVLRGDIWKALDRLVKEEKFFDIIYIDPPYKIGETLDLWKRMETFLPALLAKGGVLFVEQAKGSVEPSLPNLQSVNSRQMGAAVLHQFQKEES